MTDSLGPKFQSQCGSTEVTLRLGDCVPVVRKLDSLLTLCTRDAAPKARRRIQNWEARRNPHISKKFSLAPLALSSRIASRETSSTPLSVAHTLRHQYQVGDRVRCPGPLSSKVGNANEVDSEEEEEGKEWRAAPQWDQPSPKDIVSDPRLCNEVGGQWAAVPSRIVTRFASSRSKRTSQGSRLPPPTADPFDVPQLFTWSHIRCTDSLKAFLSLKRAQALGNPKKFLFPTCPEITNKPTGYLPPNSTLLPKLYVEVAGEQGCPTLILEACVHPLDTLHDLRQRIAAEFAQRSGAAFTSQLRFSFTKFQPPILAWLGSLQRAFEMHLKDKDLLHAQGEAAIRELKQQIRTQRLLGRTVCACISEIRKALEKRVSVADIMTRVCTPKISTRCGLPGLDNFYPYEPLLPLAINRQLFKNLRLKLRDVKDILVGGVPAAVLAEFARMESALLDGKDASSLGARKMFGFGKRSTPPPASIPHLETPRFTFRRAALEIIRRARWAKARKLHDFAMAELYKRHQLRLASPPSKGPSRLPPRVILEQERVLKMQTPDFLLLPVVHITIDESIFLEEHAVESTGGAEASSAPQSQPTPQPRLKQYSVVSALVDTLTTHDPPAGPVDTKKRNPGVRFEGSDKNVHKVINEDYLVGVLQDALCESTNEVPLDWRDGCGLSLLHYAVLHRAPKVLAILCRHNADPTYAVMATGDTVLHFILKSHNSVHVKADMIAAVLGNCGAHVLVSLLGCVNRQGDTPLTLACRLCKETGRGASLVRMLCSAKDGALLRVSPKHAMRSPHNTFEEALAGTVLSISDAVRQIDLDTVTWWFEESGWELPALEVPLLCVALQTRPPRDDDESERWNEMFALLLKRRDLTPNEQDARGRNAFHYAARSGALDCLEAMMDAVCDPGRVPYGELNGSLTAAEMTTAFHTTQAHRALAQDDDCRQTFLHAMLEWCPIAACEALAPMLMAHPLIAIYGVGALKPDISDHFGNTLLHWSMLRRSVVFGSEFVKCVEYENSVYVQSFLALRNGDGDSPLGSAIRSHFSEGVAMITRRPIAAEIALRVLNSHDRAPLLMAVDCMVGRQAFGGRHTAVMDERPHCAARESSNIAHTLIRVIAKSEDPEGIINARSGANGDTALHSAISNGAWHVAAQLFTHLASCNVANNCGITARRIACADPTDIALARLVLGNDRSAAASGEALMECVECGGAAAFSLRLLDEFFFSRSTYELDKTQLGYNLLKAAAKTANIVLLRALLERGARELPEAAAAVDGEDESMKTGAVLALLLRSIRIAKATPRGAGASNAVPRGATVVGVPAANRPYLMSVEGMEAAESLCVLLLRLGFRLTKTVLGDAICCALPKVAIAVLESMECDAAMVDYHDLEMGNTPLHLACNACGTGTDEVNAQWQDIAFALCDRTSNVGALNAAGESALGVALRRNAPLVAVRLILSGHLFGPLRREFSLVMRGVDATLSSRARHQAYQSTMWIRQRSAMSRTGMLVEAVCGGRMDIVDMFATAAQRTERHTFAELLMAPFDKSSGGFRSLTAALGDADLVSLDCVLSVAAANVPPSILRATLDYCFDTSEATPEHPTNVGYGCLRAASMAAITAGKIRNAELLIDRMVTVPPVNPITDSFRVYCRFPSILHAAAATRHKSRRLLRLFRSLLREGIDLEGITAPRLDNEPFEQSATILGAFSINSVNGVADMSIRLEPQIPKESRFLHVLPNHALDIQLLILKGLSARGMNLPTVEDVGTADKEVYEAEMQEALEEDLYTESSEEEDLESMGTVSMHSYRHQQPYTRSRPHFRRRRADLIPEVVAPSTPKGIADAMMRILLQCLNKDDFHDPTPESEDEEDRLVEDHHPTDFFTERQREKINPAATPALEDGRDDGVAVSAKNSESASVPSDRGAIVAEPLHIIPTIAVDACDGSSSHERAMSNSSHHRHMGSKILGEHGAEDEGKTDVSGGMLMGTTQRTLLTAVSDLATTLKERAALVAEEENARQLPHNSFVACFTMDTLELVLRHGLTHTLNLVLSHSKRFPQVTGNLSQHVLSDGQRVLNAVMKQRIPNTAIKKAIDAARQEAQSWREHGTWWVETILDVRHPELVRRIPAAVRSRSPFLCLFRDIARSDPTTAPCVDPAVDEETPLHSAVRYNRPKVVAHILQSTCVEVDVNARSRRGRTALALAARLNRMEAASQLVSTGVDLLVEDEDGMTALHFAAAAGAGNIVELLLADDDGPEVACNPSTKPLSSFPVMKALQHGKDDCALELLTSHATERTPLDIRLGPTGETLLHFAAAHNCTLTMDTIIRRCQENRMEAYLHKKSFAGYSCRDYCAPHSSADVLLERAGVKRVMTAKGAQFALQRPLTIQETTFYAGVLENKFKEVSDEGLMLLANTETSPSVVPSVDEAAFDAATQGRDADLLKILKPGGQDHVRLRAYNLPRIPNGEKDKAAMGKEIAAALGRFGGVRGTVAFETEPNKGSPPVVRVSTPLAKSQRNAEMNNLITSGQPFARLRLNDPEFVGSVLASENVMVRQLPLRFTLDAPLGPAYRTDGAEGSSSLLHNICRTGCRDSLAFVIDSNTSHGVLSKVVLDLLGRRQDEGGFTPFHLAVIHRNWSCVALLIRSHITQSPWIPREFADSPAAFTAMKLPPNALFTPLRCFPSDMDRHVMGLHAPPSYWSFDKTASWGQTEEVYTTLLEKVPNETGDVVVVGGSASGSWKQVSATPNYDGGAIFYAQILKCEPNEADIPIAGSTEEDLARSRRALLRRYASVPPEIARLSRDILNANLERVVPTAISTCKRRLVSECLEAPAALASLPVECQRLFEDMVHSIKDLAIETDIEELDARDAALERERLKAIFLYHLDGGSLFAQLEDCIKEFATGRFGAYGWIALRRLASIELVPCRTAEEASVPWATVRREPPSATMDRIAKQRAKEALLRDSDDDYDLEEHVDDTTGEIVTKLKKKQRIDESELGLEDAVNGGGYGSVHIRFPLYAGARHLVCPSLVDSLKDFFVCEAVEAGYDLIKMVAAARNTTHQGLLLNLFVCDKLPALVHRLLASLSCGIFEAATGPTSRRVSVVSQATVISQGDGEVSSVDTVMAELRSILAKSRECTAATLALQLRHVAAILSVVLSSAVQPLSSAAGGGKPPSYAVNLGGADPTFILDPTETTLDVVVVFGEASWFDDKPGSGCSREAVSPAAYQASLADILASVLDASHISAITISNPNRGSVVPNEGPQPCHWDGSFALPNDGPSGSGAPLLNPMRLTMHDQVPITDSRMVITVAAKFQSLSEAGAHRGYHQPQLKDMALFRGGSWNWRRMGLYRWTLATEEGAMALDRFYKTLEPTDLSTNPLHGGGVTGVSHRPSSVLSVSDVTFHDAVTHVDPSPTVVERRQKSLSKSYSRRILSNDERLSLDVLKLEIFAPDGPLVSAIGTALDSVREFASRGKDPSAMTVNMGSSSPQNGDHLWPQQSPHSLPQASLGAFPSTFLAVPGTQAPSRKSSFLPFSATTATLEGYAGGSVEAIRVALRSGEQQLTTKMSQHIDAAAAEDFAESGHQLTNGSFALGDGTMSMGTAAMSGLFSTNGGAPGTWALGGLVSSFHQAAKPGSGGLRPGALRVVIMKVLEFTDPAFVLSTLTRVSSVWRAATFSLLADGVFEDSCAHWMQVQSNSLVRMIDEERKMANWRMNQGFLVVPVGVRESVRKWLMVDSMTTMRTDPHKTGESPERHIVASDSIDKAYLLFLQDPWGVFHWCTHHAGGPSGVLDKESRGPFTNNRIIKTIRQFFTVAASASEIHYRCDRVARSIAASRERLMVSYARSQRYLAVSHQVSQNTSMSVMAAVSSANPTPSTSTSGYANKLRSALSATVPAAGSSQR